MVYRDLIVVAGHSTTSPPLWAHAIYSLVSALENATHMRCSVCTRDPQSGRRPGNIYTQS